MDLEEKNTLFKIRRTVLEMVSDRKYIIPLSENIDFEEVIQSDNFYCSVSSLSEPCSG